MVSPNKPIMLAEWELASFPTRDKAQWIEEAFGIMKSRFPRLKAAVFWSERWQNDDGNFSNLRVTSSPQSIEAYRKGWLIHTGSGRLSIVRQTAALTPDFHQGSRERQRA
jgi:hypothetical protein